jgi:hypothetical protein
VRVSLLYILAHTVVLSGNCYALVTGNGGATEGAYVCNPAAINFLACARNLTIFVSNLILYYKIDCNSCTLYNSGPK